jgi:hypothetical protein
MDYEQEILYRGRKQGEEQNDIKRAIEGLAKGYKYEIVSDLTSLSIDYLKSPEIQKKVTERKAELIVEQYKNKINSKEEHS